MDRDEVWQAIDHERSGLADLFDDLSEQEWETASLCAGWRVRDVAAHLTLAQTRVLTGAYWLLKARGDINRMIHDSAVRQAGLPVRHYGALLRGMAGSRRKAPGVTHLEPLIDALVHGQDIAIPLGRDRPMPVRAAAAAATRVWTTKWPLRMWPRLDGLELAATDCPWSAGRGRRVEGPISAILLSLTGRTVALSRLTGPGAAELQARLSPATGRG
ncbi:maleylpyruvate isomerase family mycothiol-dependent enzyme [Planomonospora sp. ID67723]|uniref:maleylpyruvate isomerase family mycothiol-dependent enzyme n=1 Tax=Planomonospora sp. ID67723 TaxID=2738134 RepID=UPI0018C3F251|nr:maleylpyruvate isomerase family mycothiol-dependent enzyme [Planomonospora sp. ID67723]MBG0831205.1 maleylpyruvate isomerase family mycothiol-dependent enzyme [Planomonospora sp. ID67723]